MRVAQEEEEEEEEKVYSKLTGAVNDEDDGEAVACGRNDYGQCNVPARPAGTRYVAAAAGGRHSIMVTEATSEAVAEVLLFPV